MGSGSWPSITQADDGMALIAWESSGSLWRRYASSSWDSPESLLDKAALNRSRYPNLKLGANGGKRERARVKAGRFLHERLAHELPG